MFAKSLESIPKIIADNAGLDSLDIINKLRHKHGNFKIIQLKEVNKTSTSELILFQEWATVSKISFGNQRWSKLML